MSAVQQQKIPPVVYGILSGVVNIDMCQKVYRDFTLAVNSGVQEVHLLLQSNGGTIGDGIAIYNFLRNLPLKVVAYNGGAVASIAVIVFLAAQERHVSESGTFLIHKSFFTLSGGTSDQLQLQSNGLKIDDERTEKILRTHLNLTNKQWKIHERGNLTFNSTDALKAGLVHSIADFKPPQGAQIFNM